MDQPPSGGLVPVQNPARRRVSQETPPAPRHFQTYLARMSVSKLTVAPLGLKPRVVSAKVCGINATLNRSSATSTKVRLIPSTVMDPLGTIWAANGPEQETQTRSQSP